MSETLNEKEVKDETIWSKIKKVFTSIFSFIGVIFTAIAGFFLIFRRRNVSDIGDRIEDTRGELESVSSELGEAGDTVQQFEQSIDSQLEGLKRVEDRIEHSEELVTELGNEIKGQREKVRECQSILESVRERGKQRTK